MITMYFNENENFTRLAMQNKFHSGKPELLKFPKSLWKKVS